MKGDRNTEMFWRKLGEYSDISLINQQLCISENEMSPESSRVFHREISLAIPIAKNRKELMKMIGGKVANLNRRDERSNETPLQCALSKGQTEIALFLVSKVYRKTLNDAMELLKYLLKRFDDIYIFVPEICFTFSPLLFFAITINKDAFEMVLSVSRIDQLYDKHRYFGDRTLLNLIAAWGNKSMLKMAIARGADLNYGSDFLDRPLYEAILHCPKMIPILAKNGAKLHCENDTFERRHVIRLRDLGTREYFNAVKTVRKFGIDFYKKFTTNENELHDLCRLAGEDNCKSFLLAIERGADINHVNNDDYCLLKFALKDDLLQRNSKHFVIRTLVSIMVKMIENNDYVSPDNIHCFMDEPALFLYWRCKLEICRLREKKIINGATISFYDFLTSDLVKLTALARNKEIIRNFRSTAYAKEFPVYRQHLKRNFERSIWRLRKVERIFQIVEIVELPQLVFEKICGYLNDEELVMSECYFQMLTEFLLRTKFEEN